MITCFYPPVFYPLQLFVQCFVCLYVLTAPFAVRAESAKDRAALAKVGDMVIDPYGNMGLNGNDTDSTIITAVRCLIRDAKTSQHVETMAALCTYIAAMRSDSFVLRQFVQELKKVGCCLLARYHSLNSCLHLLSLFVRRSADR